MPTWRRRSAAGVPDACSSSIPAAPTSAVTRPDSWRRTCDGARQQSAAAVACRLVRRIHDWLVNGVWWRRARADRTRIFADGADLDGILALAEDPRIAGFTTNPTLMRKAGLTDYASSRRCSSKSPSTRSPSRSSPTTPSEIRRQARLIASWGENVYVKIPVTTTCGRVAGAARARALRGRGEGQRHRARSRPLRSS